MTIPKRVFIIPYRNRLEQKFFYSKQMSFILEDDNDYEIYFSHQCDNRQFNRGATKNIGFLAIKEKYPQNYKNITFIFNDVDTLPFHKIFDYQTTFGTVKHYYGFEHALGGIVVIKGEDFEKINGFPNFWGWGNEDSVLQERCLYSQLNIDRSQFYKIGSPEILQLFDGVTRLVSPNEYHMGKNDDGNTGLSSIHRLTFSTDKESLNPNDNKYTVTSENIFVINILSFLTENASINNEYYDYDLREKIDKIIHPNQEKIQMKKVTTTDDWKDIPELNSKNTNVHYQLQQKQLQKTYQNQNQNQRISTPIQVPIPDPDPPQPVIELRQNYNHLINTYIKNQLLIHKQPPHKYSREYANFIGAKPRATTNTSIGLGGRR
jgi:hypothetical protein